LWLAKRKSREGRSINGNKAMASFWTSTPGKDETIPGKFKEKWMQECWFWQSETGAPATAEEAASAGLTTDPCNASRVPRTKWSWNRSLSICRHRVTPRPGNVVTTRHKRMTMAAILKDGFFKGLLSVRRKNHPWLFRPRLARTEFRPTSRSPFKNGLLWSRSRNFNFVCHQVFLVKASLCRARQPEVL